MQKIWKIQEPNPQLQLKLSKELQIHPLICQILINRGIDNQESLGKFLNGDISHLHDPFQLKDMEKAVGRIKQAIEIKEKVLIFGDYDVDGVTSCALLKLTLQKLGLAPEHYIPHRINEGYGINENAVKFAKQEKVKLFISVDCGTANHKEIDLLNKLKIDTIVIDHHKPQEGKLPKALAIVNPKRDDCNYPFKDLAAVGVVFKVAQALLKKDAFEDLDLVALGTIADVMDIVGENRIIAKEGLKRINETKKVGLKALIDAASLKNKNITPGFVSFILAPRINASGRMDSAEKSLELFLTNDIEKAKLLATDLNNHNRERQRIEEETLREALSIIERDINFKDHYVIVLSKAGWHQGVLGIVASKITDRFYRPTIIISLDKKICKGSARSIEKFHIFEALSGCAKFLETFGGHKYAAGLTIIKDNIKEFENAINRIAKDVLTINDLSPTLNVDALIALSSLDADLVLAIENLEPFGVGNPYPLLCSRNLKIRGKPSIVGRDTIKFWVTDGKLTAQAIGFGQANLYQLICESDSLDMVFSPSIDDWREPREMQLEVKDIKFH
ncbi:MAG: single-stranded-DNA-specific exonuclease RecJ [Candidatus Omnitrophica bacterium]|nr:single-stranded-DNA-specific exonuclease RecJ [Candidatus Omnitrophota bacterium]